MTDGLHAELNETAALIRGGVDDLTTCPAALLRVDPAGIISDVSPSAAAQLSELGLSWHGRSVDEALPGLADPRRPKFYSQLDGRLVVIGDSKVPRASGAYLAVDYHEVHLSEGTRLVRVIHPRTTDTPFHAGVVETMQHALAATHAGVWDYDTEKERVIGNARLAEMVGSTPEAYQWTFADWYARIHPDDRASCDAQTVACDQGADVWECEYRVQCADGSYRWVRSRAQVASRAADGRARRFVGFSVDVNRRKLGELQLRESELRYRTLAENFPDGALFLVDREGRYVFVDGRALKDVGLTKEDLIGKLPHEIFPPDVAGPAEAHLPRVLQGEAVYYEVPYQGRIYAINAVPLGGSAEEVAQVLYIATEITERKRLEQAEREAHERLRGHLDNTPLAAVEWDPDLQVIHWSPQAERLFGWSAAEVVGRSWDQWRFVHDDDLAHVAAVSARLRDGRDERNVFRNRNYTKAGEIIECEWHNSVLRSASGEIVSVFSLVMDVTIQRRLEEQLRQAQKMEAVGQLAGGVAHDFNNILTAVLGNVELLRLGLENTAAVRPELVEYLDQIDHAGRRAAALTRQLLSFSRRRLVRPAMLDLNGVLDEVQGMLRRLIPENVTFTTKLADTLPLVYADPIQIEQIVVNLAVNARDAMPHGGRLEVTTSTTVVRESELEARQASRTGPHVTLRVTDTGVGMDAETQRRIFEPFFTTKPAGVGTGLGLATVLSIVKQCGGHVTVDSHSGRGTVFGVHFPAADGDPPAAEAPAPVERLDGVETLLLCDDDAAIRAFARQVLSQRGYRVLEAGAPDEALRVLRGTDERVHLLISDVVLPGMDGYRLAQQAGTLRPGLRALLVSGYPLEALQAAGDGQCSVTLLEKPFDARSLARRVRQVLDE